MTTDKDRIQTLEHECARLGEQNAMLRERCRFIEGHLNAAKGVIEGLLRVIRENKHD